MIEIQRSETWQVQERMVSTLEQMLVPNGIGLGVPRSKRPLLACRTLQIFHGTSRNLVKVGVRSSSVSWFTISEMSD